MVNAARSRVLVVLDGAAEPVAAGRTTFEEARTPVLDALCRDGAVALLRTTPDGLEPGSETGVPTLLGAPPTAPVGRGWVEAAAAGVDVPEGRSPWRIDVRHLDGRRTCEREVRLVWPVLRAQLPAHRVTPLRGHRLLALGERPPAISRCAALDVRVWPDGARLEAVLDERTTMICGPGAAAGCAKLLGARVVVPDGATGDVDTDLPAKARAAVAALAAGGDVVVHVGGLDEASHRLQRDAKRALLEQVDGELLAPLAAAARRHGAPLAITSDHGTCPRTGRHDAAPVPVIVSGGRPAAGPQRLAERALHGAPVLRSPWEAVPC